MEVVLHFLVDLLLSCMINDFMLHGSWKLWAVAWWHFVNALLWTVMWKFIEVLLVE